ncbi:MAG: lysylphosphatidylglycerol synthase transmembrane domain-containing protein [Betaproteobacteria bacterium]
MKNSLRYALLFLGLAALAYFLVTLDWSALRWSVERVNLFFLLGAVSASLFNIATKAVRWQRLIRSATSVRISFMLSVGSVYAGVASSSLVPGKAIDVAKPLILKRFHRVPLTPSTAAMLVERALDMLSVAIIFLTALAIRPPAVGPTIHVLAGVAVALLAFLAAGLTFPHAFLRGVGRAMEALPVPLRLKRRIESVMAGSGMSLLTWCRHENLWPLLGLSLVSLGAEVVRFYCVFRSVGLTVAPWGLTIGYMASILVAVVSLIPGGVGVTESFQAAFLQLFVIGEAAPGVERGAVLLDRVLSYYLVVLIGAAFLLWYQHGVERRGPSPERSDVEGRADDCAVTGLDR